LKLREAVRGRVTKHHRFLLRLHLNQIDALKGAMATIDAQVEANLGPFRSAVELIMSIPGIESLSAQVIVSEIGIDMSRFPSAAHLMTITHRGFSACDRLIALDESIHPETSAAVSSLRRPEESGNVEAHRLANNPSGQRTNLLARESAAHGAKQVGEATDR
jgi:Transposase IS116/IS110/IS902 family